ncbi:hypothetical protein PT2222_10041 [Paraburkholderia tropica]
MAVVCLADVHQRQHHENERLQQNDQDVEDRPDAACNHVADEAKHRRIRAEGPQTAQQGDQQEQQFACIHVAEQPQGERNRLGDELDDVECKVRDPQQRMRAERRRQQLVGEAAGALDLEVVIDHQHEHAERDAERAVEVGGRDDALMRECFGQTQPADHAARQVDGDEVEGVHQRHPDEHRQGQRSDEFTVAVNDGLRLVFDHFDQHFDGALEAARHARRGLACGDEQQQDGDDTTQDRPEQRVDVPDVEIDDRRLMRGGKILQVVRNVLGRIQSARSFAGCHIVKTTQIVENRFRPFPRQPDCGNAPPRIVSYLLRMGQLIFASIASTPEGGAMLAGFSATRARSSMSSVRSGT